MLCWSQNPPRQKPCESTAASVSQHFFQPTVYDFHLVIIGGNMIHPKRKYHKPQLTVAHKNPTFIKIQNTFSSREQL